MLRSSNIGLSTPTPIAFKPLSTYRTVPVIADAKGDAKKAAALPTSSVRQKFDSVVQNNHRLKMGLGTLQGKILTEILPAESSFCRGALAIE